MKIVIKIIMEKKKGNFLVETIISLSIIVLILSILPGTLSKAELSNSSRTKFLEINESLVAVSKELKYNNSYETIKNKLQPDGIKIAYTEEFLDDILEKNLFDMDKTIEEDNFIKINIINEEKNFMEIKIEIDVSIYGNRKKMEHIMLKDKWMDYVY